MDKDVWISLVSLMPPSTSPRCAAGNEWMRMNGWAEDASIIKIMAKMIKYDSSGNKLAFLIVSRRWQHICNKKIILIFNVLFLRFLVCSEGCSSSISDSA